MTDPQGVRKVPPFDTGDMDQNYQLDRLAEQIKEEYPKTAGEIAAGVTIVNPNYFPGIVHRYGPVGDGIADDTVGLQAAIDMELPIYVPPGKYRTTGELIWKDNSNLFGPVMTSGRRDANYNTATQAVIFYDGAGGALSCVARMSATAVGTAAGDLSGEPSDDLFGVQCRNIIIDGNAKAEFGFYLYRVSFTNIGPLSATGCKEVGIFIIGCFTNTFTNLIGWNNEKNGIEIGRNRFASWSENEVAVNANLFISPHGRGNGTGETYDEGVEEEEGHGIFWRLNRGNIILNAVVELNDGAGHYFLNDSENPGGPNKFIGGYYEANMADAVADGRATHAWNMIFEYSQYMRHLEIDSMYMSSSSSQDIKINSATDIPVDEEAYLTFRNCFFRDIGQVEIDSNTPAYRVIDCSPRPSYTDELPHDEKVYSTTSADATPSVAIGHSFLLIGTTTITDFDDGQVNDVITLQATAAITITDNVSIFLAGGVNFVMANTDVLVLKQFSTNVWKEVSRSVN